jgi:hypothetical protein
MLADGSRSADEMAVAYFQASTQVERIKSRLVAMKTRLRKLYDGDL